MTCQSPFQPHFYDSVYISSLLLPFSVKNYLGSNSVLDMINFLFGCGRGREHWDFFLLEITFVEMSFLRGNVLQQLLKRGTPDMFHFHSKLVMWWGWLALSEFIMGTDLPHFLVSANIEGILRSEFHL